MLAVRRRCARERERERTILVWREVVVQLEVFSDLGPHIAPLLHQFEQEWHQLHQLVV